MNRKDIGGQNVGTKTGGKGLALGGFRLTYEAERKRPDFKRVRHWPNNLWHRTITYVWDWPRAILVNRLRRLVHRCTRLIRRAIS